MAEQRSEADENLQENTISLGDSPSDEDQSVGFNLEKFITDEYEKQKNQGKLEATEDIDDDRAANFFARALGESKRMDAETQKSYKKMAKLHENLGAERFTTWRQEHAAEVLLPQEIAAVEHHSYSHSNS